MSILTSCDSYTMSSEFFASESARKYSCYNFANRYSPSKAWSLAQDSRMVFFGISHFVENYLMKPVTKQDVEEMAEFMKTAHSFGGELPFPKELWMRVVDEFNGFLPLEVEGLCEGLTFFPNEPVVTVNNTVEGFGELAAWVEARLVGNLSRAIGVATLCRHWLESERKEVEMDLKALGRTYTKEDIDAIAQWQIHNFGSRGCFSEEDSTLTGLAHLLSFNGTDNFDAAKVARRFGAKPPIGTSIIALAHRNVMGHVNQQDCFNAIAKADKGKMKVVACVLDTYNYEMGIKDLIQAAKDNPDTIFVGRPDSNPNGWSNGETINELVWSAINSGFKTYENNFPLPSRIRYIYGDSVTWESRAKANEELRSYGVLPTLWGINGVGGTIINSVTRDTLSSAYKLCETTDGGKVKLSESETKLSVPFKTQIYEEFPRVRKFTGQFSPLWRRYYFCNENQLISRKMNFTEARTNCIQSFDTFSEFANISPNFGVNRESLSEEIRELQDEVYRLYR